MLLRDKDQIEVGPFRLVFRQIQIGATRPATVDLLAQTIFVEKLG